MPYSYQQYTGNGSTATFTVPFPYLLRAHVKLYYGLNLQSGGYGQLLVDGTNYTWLSATQVQITPAPPSATVLTIRRETPTSGRLVDWNDGSAMTAADMDTADLQNFYVVQEQKDYIDAFTINPNTNIVDGAITASKLSSDAVTTPKIIDSAVTTAKLADASVTTGKIADGAVGTADLADASVTTAKLVDSAVTAGKIADGAVGTADLADASVTTAKLADASVTTGKIADGAVGTADLADASVATAKLADASVTTAKLAASSVTSEKLASGAAVPVGAVFHFAASTAPAGYLKCNGNTVPNGSGTVQGVTADFSALYAVVGSAYGSLGKLPDLRGEFVRGWDDSRGVDSGRTIGSAQADDFKSHTHTDPYGPNGSITGSVYSTGGGSWTAFQSGATGGTETRPRNVALLACIKY